MRRIGHRGAKGHAPDNTIESFQKALDLGCDEVETDVWLMLDGAFVIAHDRPATSAGALKLDDVLDFCRGRMGVNVELKCEYSETLAHETGSRIGAHLARRADRSGRPVPPRQWRPPRADRLARRHFAQGLAPVPRPDGELSL
jgi:hypothetical protein